MLLASAAAWGVTVVLLGLAPRLWLAAVALLAGAGANFVDRAAAVALRRAAAIRARGR